MSSSPPPRPVNGGPAASPPLTLASKCLPSDYVPRSQLPSELAARPVDSPNNRSCSTSSSSRQLTSFGGRDFSPAQLASLIRTKHFYAIQLAFGAFLVLIMVTAPCSGKLPWAHALICLFKSAVCSMISYRLTPTIPRK